MWKVENIAPIEHDLWCDEVFSACAVLATNDGNLCVKSRFDFEQIGMLKLDYMCQIIYGNLGKFHHALNFNFIFLRE